jgi:hypothetical protein
MSIILGALQYSSEMSAQWRIIVQMVTAIGVPFFGIIPVATKASQKTSTRDLRVLKRIQLDYPVYFLFGT